MLSTKIFILYLLFKNQCLHCQGLVPKADEILTLQDSTIVQLKTLWNVTHATYALQHLDPVVRITTFWNSLKAILAVLVDQIRSMERRIIMSQPSLLLNKIIQLQELEALKEASDTITDDEVLNWKVKWIEVSSLATHIHWLFNKRIRDIMNNTPYIKTVANSLARYYGNPWYAKLSGRTNEGHRFPMRDFPRWIDNRTFAVKQGNLFVGLRKLIEDCKTCKGGSSFRKDACMGTETLEQVVPIKLDAPIYVFLYLCLVDIKFYILKNFFHIYREAYENIEYPNYAIFDDRLQSRVQKKVDAFSQAFKDYDLEGKDLTKVSKGYFNCDPLPSSLKRNIRNHIYNKTYLKLTNFATDFVALEKDLTPLNTCSRTCKEIGRADVSSCQKSDADCLTDIFPECLGSQKCDNFKPLCPAQDLVCYKTGESAQLCLSDEPGKLIQWVLFNKTSMLPKHAQPKCNQPLVDYIATTQRGVTGKPELCEVCLCQCMEPFEIKGSKASIRSFSLNEVTSSIRKNRVIIGIKFEQVEDQIHLMIADAVSIARMKVDMSTLEWRQANKKADASNPNEVARVGRNLRAILLDDLKVPIGYVITGVRFATITSENSEINKATHPHIGIKIKVTKVDNSTGALSSLPGDSEWIINNSTDPKSIYRYISPDDPVKGDGPSLPDSSVNQLIYFRSTTLTKTNVNEVIPYFDAQKIVATQGHALRGIGLYHKVKSGHGGFLGFKLTPYSIQ